MTDTTTHEDQTTTSLMEAVNQARILLASEAHRSDLLEMAKISNDLLALKARYDELQTGIDKRNKVYTAAEEALGAHLAQKHVRAAPAAELPPATTTEAPPPSRRQQHETEHASNCAVFFDEPCDCL